MEFKISPEEYSKILGGMELNDISLVESSAKCSLRSMQVDDLIIELTNDSELSVLSDKVSLVNEHFRLQVKEPNSDRAAVSIEAVFRLSFSTKTRPTEEFFEIYQSRSLKLNSWPYFREFIQSMTSRMNIPPLTLPLFKTDWGSKKSDSKKSPRKRTTAAKKATKKAVKP